MNDFPSRFSRPLLLLGLTIGAFALRLWILSSSSEPLGRDGYYYVVQVEHLIRTGHLHAPDASWVLRLMVLFVPWLEPTGSIKVVACLLAALCVPAAALLGKQLVSQRRGESDRSDWALAWLLATVFASSMALGHLAAEFPKTLGAVAPLLCALAVAMRARSTEGRSRVWILLGAVVLTLASALAHRMAAVLIGAGIVGGMVGFAFSGRHPLSVLVGGMGGALVLGVAGYGLLATQFPNLLHRADLTRVLPELRLFSGPPTPLAYFHLHGYQAPEALEIALGWPALVLGVALSIRDRRMRGALGSLLFPLFLCIGPLWRTDDLDLGFRLSLFAPVFSWPLLAISAWEWTPRSLWLSGLSSKVQGLGGAGVAAMLLLLAPLGIDLNHPDYERFQRLISRIDGPLPALLIAEPGMSFFYDHLTGLPALAWAPEEGLNRASIGRVAWGIRDGEWNLYAAHASPPPVRLDADYTYVREDVWEDFRRAALAGGDDDLFDRLNNWRNPHASRPLSVMRNHALP